MRIVKGPIFMYFETGMEGCQWAIQDMTTIPESGYWPHEGLSLLTRKSKIQSMTIFKDNQQIWSGNPKFESTYTAVGTSIEKYVVSHTYETGHVRIQLQFEGCWFHNLPSEGNMDIWKDILANEKAYTAEVEFKD